VAEGVSEASGRWVTTLLVDSMQVYEEIPLITNQARARPAELAGIVSVAEEWAVARHKERAMRVIDGLNEDLPFVLDAGTGMYLNAIVFEIPLSPKVPAKVRAEAEKLAAAAENPRREARRLELELTGAPERRSIWEAPLRYEASFLYLRPHRQDLVRNINARCSKIVREGAEEAKRLLESGTVPNPSAREAIGLKEMLLYASGELSDDQAEETIAARTRRLARRQIRWFDKLARTLPRETRLVVVESPKDIDALETKHVMHDIIGEW
jgi:tRNA dimethylallyltransferase